MSSIAMAADSTQSDLREEARKRKLKKKDGAKKKKKDGKSKKGQKKKKDQDLEASECDSDLDLTKELKPISAYIRDRDLTVDHLFRSISGKKMKAMLPEILKPIPLEELKKLCLEQLECMSRKRIKRLLQGADPETISSSGTDDDDLSTDDDVRRHRADDSIEEESKSDLVVDSTCQKSEDANNADELIEDLAGSQGHTPSDRSVSARGSRTPASSEYRSPGSERHSAWGSQYCGTSDGESRYSSSSYNVAGSSEESESETEYIEEVVVEELYLDEGDDLEQVLRTRMRRSSIQEIIVDSEVPQIGAEVSSHKQTEGSDGPQESNVTITAEGESGGKGENMDINVEVLQASVASGSQVPATDEPMFSPSEEIPQPAEISDEVKLDTEHDKVTSDSQVSTEARESPKEEETLLLQTNVGTLGEQSAEGKQPEPQDMPNESSELKSDTGKILTDTVRETESTEVCSTAAIKEPVLESEVPMEVSTPEDDEAVTEDVSMDKDKEETEIPNVQPMEHTCATQDPLPPEQPTLASSSEPVTDDKDQPLSSATLMDQESDITGDKDQPFSSMTLMDQESDPSNGTTQIKDEADTANGSLEAKDRAEELEEGELEEGELEDSSEEDQQVDEPQTRSPSEDENIEQVKDFPKTRRTSKVKKKKRKVKVIKRVIKVIRRKAIPQQIEDKSVAGLSAETAAAVLTPSKPEDLSDAKDVSHTSPSAVSQPESLTQKVIGKPSTVKDKIETQTQPKPGESRPKSTPGQVKTDTTSAKSKSTKDSASAEEKALNKMEILELEMRARAIKAMLRKHEEGGPTETKPKRIKLKRN